jgi:hypothetical protein
MLAVLAEQAAPKIKQRDAMAGAAVPARLAHHAGWVALLQEVGRYSPELASALDGVWFGFGGWEAVEHALRCAEFGPVDPVTRVDVARMFGVHPATLDRWIREFPPGSPGGTPVPAGRDVPSGALSYVAADWMGWRRPAGKGRA